MKNGVPVLRVCLCALCRRIPALLEANPPRAAQSLLGKQRSTQTVAQLLDFTIDPRTRQHRSDDPGKLNQRIVNVVQTHTRNALQRQTLEQALRGAEDLAGAVLGRIREEQVLQQRADQATYARRTDAVEQERKIKQNELSTALDLEQRRQVLVDLQGDNARKQATFTSEATRIELEPFGELNLLLVITSHMPDYGVIFSDGIEADYLAFNSGLIARVGLAERKAHLIVH